MMVFGCCSGKMYSIHSNWYLLRGNNGSVIESYDTGGIMMCLVLMTLHKEGVALYQVLDGVKDSKIVVSGSDHGIVYMFERRDGSVSKLTTEGTAWVQTVATANVDGISTIIAASSRDVGTEMSKIYIWKKQSQPLSTPETTEDDALTLACKNWSIIVLLVALLTLNSQLIASGEAELSEGDINIVLQCLGWVHESPTGIEQKKKLCIDGGVLIMKTKMKQRQQYFDVVMIDSFCQTSPAAAAAEV
ncbi:hypothetical protein EDD18DRAFT_1106594 [Armillaria luteobubalina]|uniref:Uncharacterized protein n=1 Tax=Armillaria luteobubalina TaxID=153913 RepID=A0AA39Q361_9AGAR|nr:hypothetical protein EDD18DRAFT_1106594 [Armillaria luteobubalina]